jgi:hypothetical protein
VVASVSFAETPIVVVPAVAGAVHETFEPEVLLSVPPPEMMLQVIVTGFPAGEVASHERTDVPPRTTEAGLAVRTDMVGGLLMTLTLKVAVLDCDPSLTDKVITYVPAVVGAVH